MISLTLREPPGERRRQWMAAGFWTDESLGPMIDRFLTAHPAETFSVRSERRPFRGCLGDVHEVARRVAAGLRARGVGPGDTVAFQLPNWAEAAAVFWGTAMAGAVIVPIVHIYGRKEVSYILSATEPRVLVTADRFGHQDFLANLADATAADDVEVFVVGDEPGRYQPFSALLTDDDGAPPAAVDPASPALIAFTSGTTADPKGVVHTHRGARAEVHQLSELRGSGDRPLLVGAPVGHAIGMLSGLLIPLHRGHPVHLIDVWYPPAVLAAMVEDGLNGGSGSTYFIQSLVDHPDCGPEHLALLAKVGLGGSPVPAPFADRLAALGISVVRSFGCTEHPSITGSRHDAPARQRMYTDGKPLPGVEIRLVDDAGDPVNAGEAGEILSRGPDLFGGYTDQALTAAAFTPDGFFRTGDIGVLDHEGCLTITDRKSDVIIRGGENISAAEVEGELLRIEGIAEVAVVAAPDPRLGERACAFIRAAPGVPVPDLDVIRARLQSAGLARQKWPEDVRVVDDFPRTPAGKIKKFVLRGQLRSEPGTDRAS